MRKSKLLLLLSTALITTSVIFMAACKKSATTATDTGFTTDQSTADKSYEDAETAADAAAVTPTGSAANFRTTGVGSGCAMVTRTTSGTDTVITIDFGTTDCTCIDGRKRRGEIIVTYTGPYTAQGTVITITFNNYYQNDNQVTGTKTITNMGLNSSNQTYFDVTVSGSVILASGAGTISETANRVRTWITQGDPNVYQITGTGTLTRANGNVVTISIPTATPLVIASNCEWIESGTVNYTLANGMTASLDYGSTPNCSPECTLTYNGKTYSIVQK